MWQKLAAGSLWSLEIKRHLISPHELHHHPPKARILMKLLLHNDQ
jgi:hypothetical protein